MTPECFCRYDSSSLSSGFVLYTLKQWTGNYQICRGPVTRRRHIVQDGYSQKSFHVDIVRERFQGIPEEYQVVKLLVGDQGAYFHVATMRAILEQSHVQPSFVHDFSAGSTCRIQIVKGKSLPVEVRPLHQISLLIVMRHKSDCSSQTITISNSSEYNPIVLSFSAIEDAEESGTRARDVQESPSMIPAAHQFEADVDLQVVETKTTRGRLASCASSYGLT
jgi:hypothetical protein